VNMSRASHAALPHLVDGRPIAFESPSVVRPADFPDVPAFRLRQLRDRAAPYYSDDALAGCRDGWWETMRRTFDRRDFYACAGAVDATAAGRANAADAGA